MANAATAKTPLPISVWGATQVTPVECTFDTTGSDLTIYTPSTGNMCAIVGIFYSEASAHNLTFTDGSDAQPTLEMPVSTGLFMGIGPNLLFVTQPSNALKIQTSVAISGPMIIYVIEANRFQWKA